MTALTPVQETPQLFTLVLLLCVVASSVTFLIAAYRAIRGRRSSSFRLLSRWAACALVYGAISVVVSLTRPARIIEPGRNWCFDDWCIAVEAVRQRPSPSGSDIIYTTDLRIYNDARLPEGARGFWAYLRDQNGRHFAPTAGAWQDVVLARVPPHGFARTSMDFVVPEGERQLGFVTGHGGPPCGLLPSLLEIGQGGCLFHKPNMIRVR
jgi:hypothetical protein